MAFARLPLFLALFFISGCASVLAPVLKPDVARNEEALRSGQYELDPAHAGLLFRIDHLGLSDFIGRFETFDASLDFEEANPNAATLEAVIDMKSLDIGNDEFAETLMGPDWFDADTFRQARFASTAITVTGENSGVLTGELTMRGVTNPVTLDVTFNGGARDRLRGAYVIGFSAYGEISRSAFGIDRFSGLITDDVRIEIQAEFLRR